MTSQIAFALISLFLIHSLVLLVNDSNLVSYLIVEKEDRMYDNHTNYLICTEFSEIKENDQLKDKTKVKDVSIKSFLNYSISSIEDKLNTTNLFQLNQSYIFFDFFCFSTNKEELEKEIPLNDYIKYYDSALFIYSNGKQPAFNEYIYFNPSDLNSFYLKTYKQKVYGEQYLKPGSKCFTYQDQLASNRYHCLNKCFKDLKFKRNFYNANENETFNLNLIMKEDENQFKKQINNDKIKSVDLLAFYSINKSYTSSCLTKCPENNCFWETYNTIAVPNNYYNNYLSKEGKDKIDLQTIIYLAYYSMNDFYAQLFGLIALFTGCTVVNLLTKIINWLNVKIQTKYGNQNRSYVEKYLKYIHRYLKLTFSKSRLIIILISLIFVLVQSGLMMNDFRFKSTHPNKTTSLTYSSDPFSIVVCFPIEVWIAYRKASNLQNIKILKSNNFSKIELMTESMFKEKFDFIEINYGYNKINFNWTVSTKVIFKNSIFDNQSFLSRCYRIEFEIKEELKYKNILPLSTLTLKFNTFYWQVYLIERNQPFTSNMVNFGGLFFVRKRSKISSETSQKSNCVDYSKKNNSRCSNRRHCIDQCINKKFYEKYNSLTIYSVIDKDEFESDYNLTQIKFNKTKDSTIETDCINTFNRPDCNDVFFEESLEYACKRSYFYLAIKLNYENLEEKEFQQSSLKLFLDLMNLLSIFFGLSVIGILSIVLIYLKIFLKLNWYKVFNILVIVVCSIMCLLNNIMVFQTIIKGDLIKNEYFTKLDKYNLPNSIYCFKYDDSKIDKNTMITGEQLDELTSDLTFKNVFKKIEYFNKTHEKDLNMNKLNTTTNSNFYSNSEISIAHFYYLNLKCFEIVLKPSFKEEDFYFKINKLVMDVHLNNYIYRQHPFAYFLYRDRESKQIGGNYLYRIKKPSKKSDYKYHYAIEFQLIKIEREDKFEFLKNPVSLFFETTAINDATKYLEAMKQKFKNKYGLASRDSLLDDFKLKIDDLLFKQFYLQIQNLTDHNGLTSLNFKKNVYNMYTQIGIIPLIYPDFRFSLSSTSRQVEISNEDNYTKLIINILNAVSFWLGLCVFDLSAVNVNRLFKLNLNLYQLLFKLKLYLHSKIRINLIPQNCTIKFAVSILDALIL